MLLHTAHALPTCPVRRNASSKVAVSQLATSSRGALSSMTTYTPRPCALLSSMPQRTMPRSGLAVVRAAILPPNISQESAIEAAIGVTLMCIWGALLFQSFSFLAAYAMSKSTAGVATNMATASISSSTVVAKAPLPVLLLRAIAALCGISISALASFFAIIPAVGMRVLQALFLALVGSLLHMT